MRGQLELYFRLLVRWNPSVNLTSLPLDPPTEDSLDRLFVEPMVAAGHVPATVKTWVDVGSGGGSPAIPLKLLRPQLDLTMVETKAKKTAFLREAARELKLHHVRVETARVEELAGRPEFHHQADLVTVRAVRTDEALLSAIHVLLKPAGLLLLFRGSASEPGAEIRNFRMLEALELLPGSGSCLVQLETV